MSNYREFRRRSLRKRRLQRVLNISVIVLAICVIGGSGWYAVSHFELLENSMISISSASSDVTNSIASDISSTAEPTTEPTAEPTTTPTAEPSTEPIVAQTNIAVANEQDANWNTMSYAIRVLDETVQPQGDGTTAMDYRLAAQPASGLVDKIYFDGATFIGDSLTQGLQLYDTGLPNANYCAYRSVGPQTFVNGTTVKDVNGVEQIPLDALVASAPEQVYIMLGTNSLTSNGDHSSFLAYYGQLIDMIKELLPHVEIYVQSIPPVRPEVSATKPGLYRERLHMINDELAALAISKDCYYINLWEVLADENGDFIAEYAAGDGIHMNPDGYAVWVEYLRTHTEYKPGVVYEAGTSYYIEQ